MLFADGHSHQQWRHLCLHHGPLHSRVPCVPQVAFVWPSGDGLVNCSDGPWAYPVARDNASCESLMTAFAAFLQGLADAGVRQVHFIAHSLGARMLCSALPHIRHLFQGAKAPMSLATCALLHPAYSLRAFVRRDFAVLRGMCEHITIYIDSVDNAQWAPELLFEHEPSLGRHPFALVRDLPDAGDSLTERLYGYRSNEALRLADDGVSVPLDLDVVDTSFLDSVRVRLSP